MSELIVLHDDSGEVLVRASEIFCAYRDPETGRTRIVIPGSQFHITVTETVREVADAFRESRA